MSGRGVNLADSQDGLHNPEKAKAEFAKLKAALQAERGTVPLFIWMFLLIRQIRFM